MRGWPALRSRRRRDAERRREVDEELAFHLEATTDELVADGWRPCDARAEAERRLGAVDALRAACLAAHGLAAPPSDGDPLAMALWQSARHALRTLRRQPAFTAAAVLTLALGIGANTAVFSVVNAVLMTPLPYPEPERLLMVWESRPDLSRMAIAYPNFEDWRARVTSVEALAVYQRANLTMTGADEPERVEAARASAGLLPTLGAEPLLGRTLLDADDRPGAAPVAVIGHALWQRRFHGRADAIGQTIRLDDRPHEIVGVLPEGFEFPNRVQVYVAIGPLSTDPGWSNRGNHPGIVGVARLRDGVSLDQARAEFDQIAAALGEAYPASNRDSTVTLTPMSDVVVGETRRPLAAMTAAVVLVLLVTCANLATLLLGRGQTRRVELATRAALGATRARLVSELVVESLVLSTLGGAAGVILAAWATPALLALYPGAVGASTTIGVDATVLAFTLATTVVSGLVFGLLPAWQLTEPAHGALSERAGTGTPRARRAQAALVVAQVAVALVLLVGAGLLARSMARVLDEPLGFTPDDVHAYRLSLPVARYGEHEARAAFVDDLIARVSAVPGVANAAIVSDLPVVDGSQTSVYARERPPADMDDRSLVEYAIVSPSYFEALGIPVRRGRTFEPRDRTDAPGSVVIDEAFAREFWPGEDPIGRQIVRGQEDTEATRLTVIGVVGDIRYRGLDRPSPRPQMYFVHRQRSQPDLVLVVKSAAGLDTAGAIRGAIRAVDPALPAYGVAHLADVVADAVAPRRLATALLGAFAALAALVAVVGVYAVVAFSVASRRREFGVRLALGASPGAIRTLVLAQGARLAATGVVLGLMAAMVATRVASGLLYGVSTLDAPTYVLVTVVFAAVVLAGCLIPAERAARLDPVDGVRS